MAVSDKVKQSSSNLISNIYPSNENICPPKGLSVSIHSSQKPKANVLSAGKWINKLWDLHTIEYYSAVKEKTTGTTQQVG